MPGPTKHLSLDANFVFDLAAQKEFAHDFLEAFQKKGYALVLPPTAFRATPATKSTPNWLKFSIPDPP
ncbi:MAG TPA: hypothetical protein VHZ30_06805 [Verrucomicrobiae bacterium]|jgi:hypothetical protein|nr:hypothetical protein [Verrucomicrobiae bacterium]